ncbi:unnamed protein product [Ilex paraguariensis]|uniref:Uncharacterized protein n=1 Tax=Ilex paraguariensis TaxID=185542 RepID=A0ABC8V179_9AQUA
MATFAFGFSCSPPLSLRLSLRHRLSPAPPIFHLRSTIRFTKLRTTEALVFASLSSSFDDFSTSNGNSRSKKSFITKLIQEIEPLDVSLIQKDVPSTTVDAMKRTISGMLGLLPSNQFQVLIEALWEPLSKLLVSSMMTGYTLRNAEYKLCLERNLDIYEGNIEKQAVEAPRTCADDKMINSSRKEEFPKSEKNSEKTIDLPGLEEMTPEAQQYIFKLQSQLASFKKVNNSTSNSLLLKVDDLVFLSIIVLFCKNITPMNCANLHK